jgi:tyrosyl-tRNA synthetase
MKPKGFSRCSNGFYSWRRVGERGAYYGSKLFESSGENLDEASLPTLSLAEEELEKGVPILDLFHRLGLTASKGEARRLIEAGGARLNDVPIKDELLTLTLTSFESQATLKLSAGKKRHGL